MTKIAVGGEPTPPTYICTLLYIYSLYNLHAARFGPPQTKFVATPMFKNNIDQWVTKFQSIGTIYNVNWKSKKLKKKDRKNFWELRSYNELFELSSNEWMN